LQNPTVFCVRRIKVNGVRQGEIHTAEPLVLEPSAFEFELIIVNSKSDISPGIV